MISPLVALLITDALQYGPEFVKSLITAFQKPNVTIAEIESLFTGVKPYSAYIVTPAPITVPPPVIGSN